MKEIISIYNAHIKILAELKEAKGRRAYGLFIVEGLRSIQAFIDAQYLVEELLLTNDMVPTIVHWNLDAKTTIVSNSIIQKLSSTITPSGIIGIFKIPPNPEPERLTAGLVIAQLQDPGNMGTLIRTAAAVGAKSIVIIEGADPWSPKVIAATAGAIAHVQIFRWSWNTLLEHRKPLNLCGLVVSGGKDPDQLSSINNLLVVGNEAHGLPHAWQQQCNELVTLPMPGGTESLNAAIAGSIALYLAFVKL